MECKICVSHRIDINSVIIKNNIFLPVYCGAIYKKNDLNKEILNDNVGENISEKRNSLGELTVQYWMWKNIKADYYGLCHYRRYFSLKSCDGFRNEQNQIYLANLSYKLIEKYGISDEKKIEKYCNKYDMIVPEGANVHNITTSIGKVNNVYELWAAHVGKFFDKKVLSDLKRTIKAEFPEFYNIVEEYFNSEYHYGYNCFIMKKEYFNKLCEMQFKIINKMEAIKENAEIYKKYPRALGYIGEIFFGCFVFYMGKKNKSILHLPLIFFENTQAEILKKIKNKYYAKTVFYRINFKSRLLIKKTYYKLKCVRCKL